MSETITPSMIPIAPFGVVDIVLHYFKYRSGDVAISTFVNTSETSKVQLVLDAFIQHLFDKQHAIIVNVINEGSTDEIYFKSVSTLLTVIPALQELSNELIEAYNQCFDQLIKSFACFDVGTTSNSSNTRTDTIGLLVFAPDTGDDAITTDFITNIVYEYKSWWTVISTRRVAGLTALTLEPDTLLVFKR